MTVRRRAAIDLAPKAVEKIDTPDGGFLLRSPDPLKPYAANVTDWLERWAAEAPGRVYLAERAGEGWKRITYGEALPEVKRLAQGLVERDLGPDRAVMILSDNSVDVGLLILACLYAGVPVAPVSPAYSLVSQDHEKLRHVFGLVKPGMIYVGRGKPFEKAFKALDLSATVVVVSADPPEGIASTGFASLGREPTEALERAHAAVTPDGVAKILFTSGSTGLPKGVVNTQRMMCSNQQSIAQGWHFLERKPPVILDWLPWNHTFGGNHNFNMILRNGGSLYIDDGKPVPGAIEKTVRNLREVSPTMYFNVPRGYDVLLPYLENDPALRDAFFRDLDMVFYAAAALPQPLWTRIEDLSMASRGELVAMLSGWGSTETAPSNTMVHFTIERAGNIGLPLPGTTIKMVPNAGKLEVRVKGPNITPGYVGDEQQTRDAFDEEGYYKIGDAAKLMDPADPAQGLVFDGRVSEDFKLTTGTWVHVGGLRVAAIEAASPLIADAVVTGHNRDYIAIMAWPNLDACRALAGNPALTAEELVLHPAVVEKVRSALAGYNREQKGSSTRIEKFLLLAELPSLDGNEITDKGYINQRATLERRAAFVEKLYAEAAPEGVVKI